MACNSAEGRAGMVGADAGRNGGAPVRPNGAGAPPRYAPDRPFPPYAFVPGRTPHPTRDPRGHSFGGSAGPAEPPTDPPDPVSWRSCRPYLFAVDLFNHGYYWEAHEAWEELWHACPDSTPVRPFLQGLIRLSAAGVKARAGNARGVRRHARRAAELFRTCLPPDGAADVSVMGLRIAGLVEVADDLAGRLEIGMQEDRGAAGPAFDILLRLD